MAVGDGREGRGLWEKGFWKVGKVAVLKAIVFGLDQIDEAKGLNYYLQGLVTQRECHGPRRTTPRHAQSHLVPVDISVHGALHLFSSSCNNNTM